MASVLEVKDSGLIASAGTGSVTFSTTPTSATDVLYVAVFSNSNSTVSAVSGMGATWTLLTTKRLGANSGITIWKGVTPNASGVVTATHSPATISRIYGVLTRGLNPGYVLRATEFDNNTEANSLVRSYSFGQIQPDTLLLAFAQQVGSTVISTWPSTSTGTSWTLPAALSLTSTGHTFAGYRFVSSLETQSIGITSPSSGANFTDIVVLAIGGPDGAGFSGNYLEAATISGTATANLESLYVEAATVSTDATASLESVYLEVLTSSALDAVGPTPFIGWGVPLL